MPANSLPFTSAWSATAMSSDGSKIAAGGRGLIYTTGNSGDTWVSNSVPPNVWYYSMSSSTNGSILAAVANPGGIYVGPMSLAPAMKLGLNPGLSSGSNGFNVVLYSLWPRLHYEIDTSTNLVNWQAITNIISTNSSFYFSDPAAKNYKQRFYRAVMQ
jgi:hypothetical protein